MKQTLLPVKWEDSSRSTGRSQDACHKLSIYHIEQTGRFFPGFFGANASLKHTVKHLSWSSCGDFNGGTVNHKYMELLSGF